MEPQNPGVKDPSLADLEDLLNLDGDETPPSQETPEATPGAPVEPTEPPKETETQAFARRLKESTEKARKEERDAIAKRLGKSSYEELLAEQEKKTLEDKGLDPAVAKEVFDKMYEERIQSDPRFKELDEYRAKKAEEWGNAQIAELSKLTGGKISKISDLDEATLKRGQEEGSFVNAYMALHGAELIAEMRLNGVAKQQQNTTGHLANPSGTPSESDFRDPKPDEMSILSQFAQYCPSMEADLKNIKYKK